LRERERERERERVIVPVIEISEFGERNIVT
jgi:hypothetical protein